MLFTDPLVASDGYPLGFYQICLQTMPIFMYIIMGLSLVTCNVELVVKFRIAEIDQGCCVPTRGVREKEAMISRVERILKGLQISLTVLILAVLVCFLGWLLICTFVEQCTYETSSKTLLIPISLLNLIVWLLLTVSTYYLVRKWRERYGNNYQRNVQCKLMTYLQVFGLSYFIRGVYDTIQYFASVSDLASNIMMIFLYVFCEWVPILVIYNQHRCDFNDATRPRTHSVNSDDTLHLMPGAVPADYRRTCATIRTLDDTLD